jgi:glyoxylase-like metal-dependent hydrolase (beta-lactamase superfamily II)
MKIQTIDLDFMDTERIIASFLLLGDRGAALVETGPRTCLDRLTAGLGRHGVSGEDVRQVFLTHIHLDHAGASGHLSEVLPNATFYVHEVGYPHLVDPSKLVKSATRIYGERMEELWGETRPVPKDRIEILEDGRETEAAGGIIVAHDTPGHAYHHLAYLEPDSGALFAGDVAGIRLPGQSYVRPPTPPPEIDVEDWLLFVEAEMDEGMEREEISEQLKAKGDAEMLAEGAGTAQSGLYDLAGSYPMLTDGLMRYVTRRRNED